MQRRQFFERTKSLALGGLASLFISSSGCAPRTKETTPIPVSSYIPYAPIDHSATLPDLVIDDIERLDYENRLIRVGIGNLSIIDSPPFQVKIKAEYASGLYEKTYKVEALRGAYYKFIDLPIPKAIDKGNIHIEIDPNNKIKETNENNNKRYKYFNWIRK